LAQPTSGTIIQGESISLIASGASSYIWSPSVSLSCEDCTNPIASPTTTTTYTVTGTDISGCIGTAEVTIFVTTICGEVFVPSVFSPNGLGPTENNTLCVIGNCIAELNYSIYNRWGERVFETTDLNICWDGYHKDKPLNTGVYAYKLIATLFDGTNIEESGNLTLVR
jgi:gliding motility-associated-like protein